jgi:hypothetical protein
LGVIQIVAGDWAHAILNWRACCCKEERDHADDLQIALFKLSIKRSNSLERLQRMPRNLAHGRRT